MLPKNCLIIDSMFESLPSMLKNIGVTPVYRPDISKEEVLEVISEYDGLIVRSKLQVDKVLLDRAPDLLFIGRAGAGVDNIDLEEVERRGVQLFNAPEGNRDALAEHTMGLTLALLNNIVKSDDEIRSGIWDREGNRGRELNNKIVGLLGYGYMASAYAARLKAFGCQVLAFDKYKKGYGYNIVKETTLEDIYQQADIFSLHTPLTAETLGWVDTDFINRFKKDIWLINTARGPIVKTTALMEALQSGKVKGAALDVLENEKLDSFSSEEQENFQWLTKQKNVIFTAHIAGWSYESYQRINTVLVDKIKAHYQL
jgi:D-3-phosphoglycerate dehydrogenase